MNRLHSGKKFLNSCFLLPNSNKGQSLITLLFFTVIGMTVIAAAALIVAADVLSASNAQEGLSAYYVAESGVENGILYLLRHPQYDNHLAPPMLVTVGSGQASVVFTYSGTTDTIVSTGTFGTTKKTIQVVGSYATGPLNITTWQEVNN